MKIKLKSKLLVILERIAFGESSKNIAADYGSTRQAVEWLVGNYPDEDYTLLTAVRNMVADDSVPRSHRENAKKVLEFLENLP